MAKNSKKWAKKSRIFDEVYESIGGFGRFQYFVAVTYFFYGKALMIIILSIAFLEKVPSEYFCTYKNSPFTEESCVPADFCEDPNVVSYRPNMELDDSYTNWISHFNLECASHG